MHVCYSFRAMAPRRRFGLYPSTIESLLRLWNLSAGSIAYLAVIIGLSLGIAFAGEIMGWVGEQIGVDEKTRTYLAWAIRSVFVVLILVNLLFSLGDVAKLVWYYLRDWRDADERLGTDQEGDRT